MRICEVMDRDLTALSPDTTLSEAIEVLTRHRVSGIPVVDPSGRVLGFVSEKDIVKAALPGYFDYLQDPSFIPDYGQFQKRLKKIGQDPITKVMAKDVVSFFRGGQRFLRCHHADPESLEASPGCQGRHPRRYCQQGRPSRAHHDGGGTAIVCLTLKGAPLGHILVVCTGNTCRSPMAEAFLKILMEGRGLSGRVSSAGLCAVNGLPASSLAIIAMEEQGIDLSQHRSRQVDLPLIESSDHVVGITTRHVEALLEQFPEQSSRIRRFSLPDIADPYGSSLDSYRVIRDLLHSWSSTLLDFIGRESRDTG